MPSGTHFAFPHSVLGETLTVYDVRIRDDADRQYVVRACGGERDDGLWEGWLEFQCDDQTALRTDRETTQPNRADLAYWATGLTVVYLEGAFERAAANRAPPPRHVRKRSSLTR